jgi:hypothetical protein
MKVKFETLPDDIREFVIDTKSRCKNMQKRKMSFKEFVQFVEHPCSLCPTNTANGGDGFALFEGVPCEWRCPSLDQYQAGQV